MAKELGQEQDPTDRDEDIDQHRFQNNSDQSVNGAQINKHVALDDSDDFADDPYGGQELVGSDGDELDKQAVNGRPKQSARSGISQFHSTQSKYTNNISQEDASNIRSNKDEIIAGYKDQAGEREPEVDLPPCAPQSTQRGRATMKSQAVSVGKPLPRAEISLRSTKRASPDQSPSSSKRAKRVFNTIGLFALFDIHN
jgi:hypothetical protein